MKVIPTEMNRKLFFQRLAVPFGLSVLCFLSILFHTPVEVNAQTKGMSDQAIANIVQQEAKRGTQKSQIVTKLVQSGVNIDQIRRVRKMTGTSQNTSGTTADVSRLRQANGDQTQPSSLINSGTATKPVQDDNLLPDDDELALLIEELTPDGRRVFGRGIFNKKLLTFEPGMNIATPQNYVVGPGDVLFLDVYGASQKTEQLEVSPEGKVVVSGYGPVSVSGMTVAAAQQHIRSTVGSRYASSKLSLTVGQTRTVTVNVMGEVRAPGTYTVSAFATVFHALYLAGGIGSLGSLRSIKVFRQGRQVTSVDVYEYILNGRLAGNIHLHDNDVIVVSPYECLVDLGGKVKRPMTYEMRPNESIATLLKYAGGYTGDANKKTVRVKRIAGPRHSVFTVGEFDMSSFRVADGDAVTVDANINRYDNMVEVKGAVFRPGMYQLGGDITSVRSLIESADGLTEDAFKARAVLTRMKEDRTLETQTVDLKGIMEGTVADIPLRNEDVLTIASEEELVQNRWFQIEGEVMKPDTYDYADNTTIEDLIVMAGGLTDAASTVKVDVSRRIIDPKATKSGKEITKSYTYALKDGLLVDGGKDFVLKPYDIVRVRRSPGFVEPRTITVEGEVEFEGNYTMDTKNLRLSDIIKAAGGVTSEAFVKGARLMRRMTPYERARMEDVLRTAHQNQDKNDSIAISTIVVPDEYSVGIQLDKALAAPGCDYDIVLRDSDRLIVPEYNGTVKISGSVLFPNTVSYNDAKTNYKWYINQAGGYGDAAKRRKAYIVYQNGTVSKASKGKVEPGCEIIVPTKLRTRTEELSANLTRWVSIGTSVTSMTSIIIALTNILK